MRRQGEINRYDSIMQVWGEVQREQSELPAAGSRARIWEDEDGQSRIAPGRDRYVGWRGGLNRFIASCAVQERNEDPLRKYLDHTGESSYFKRAAGRFLYVAVNDFPLVTIPAQLYSVGRSFIQGMCPCGAHSLDYGLCAMYWARVSWHFLEAAAEDSLICRATGDSAGYFARLLEGARSVLFKHDRGRKFVRGSVRKTIVKFVPGYPIIRGVGGLASDICYVLGGRSLNISGLERKLDELGLDRLAWEELDQIIYALRVSRRSGADALETGYHRAAGMRITPSGLLDTLNVTTGLLAEMFDGTFSFEELMDFIFAVEGSLDGVALGLFGGTKFSSYLAKEQKKRLSVVEASLSKQ